MEIEVVKTLLSAKLVFITNSGREAFCVSDRLHCNSEQAVVQVVSARVAVQQLRCYRQRIGGKIGRGIFLAP